MGLEIKNQARTRKEARTITDKGRGTQTHLHINNIHMNTIHIEIQIRVGYLLSDNGTHRHTLSRTNNSVCIC